MDRALRVVHIVNIDIGVRIHLYNQMKYLANIGYDVTAVCAPGPLVPRDETTPDGIKIKTIPISQRITPFEDLRTLAQLTAYLRRSQFDIVHTHSLKPGLIGRIAARLVNTPVVLHTLHGFYFHDEMPRQKRALWKEIERIGMMFGDYTLSQSREDVDTALKEGICQPDKIAYLGNGIEIDRFDPQKFTEQQRAAKRLELGLSPEKKLVAISGRLVVEKGYKEFFAAARLVLQEHPNAHFLAVGASQPNRKDTISLNLLEEMGLQEHVTFLGMRSDFPELLAAIDIFVLPSHGREGIPRVLMEASAMGKAMVATNVRGCREAVIDNETGILVPPYNPVELAQAIKRLLTDEALAARLGVAARQYALTNFDERLYFERIRAAYEMLLARKRDQR